MPVSEKAFAKINLLLLVKHKRPDGYHELETVYQSIALHDTLVFYTADDEQVSLSCDCPGLSVGEDNLALQAALMLKKYYEVRQGARIVLKKRIPLAAGLAGGSSDAAAALRGLLRLWKLPCEDGLLQEIAAALGSDVPFCLQGGTAFATGRGERLTRLRDCPTFFVVLANPGFAVSTAEVYRSLRADDFKKTGNTKRMLAALQKGDRQEIADCLCNTLEYPAFRLYPAIGELKKKMAVNAPALMSGSGPTVFALYPDREKAVRLADSLKKEGIAVWLTQTKRPVTLEV